jgi:hypothetical protein
MKKKTYSEFPDPDHLDLDLFFRCVWFFTRTDEIGINFLVGQLVFQTSQPLPLRINGSDFNVLD